MSPQLKEAVRDALHKYKSQTDKSHYLDEQRVQDVYKKMDSSLEGFFFKRPFTLQNFNFLLQIIAEQKDFEKAQNVFQKMKELDIKPNQITYNMLIKVCAKTRNQIQAEKYYSEAKKTVGINLQIINSLMNLYCRKNDPLSCEKLVLEAKDMQMQIDTPTYTTLINSYYKAKNLKKCWEIYYDNVALGQGIEPDEQVVSLMIEISAHTHDAEKGITLFNNLEAEGFNQTCVTYNTIIKSMASRPDYAQEAIEMYYRMIKSDIKPDNDTFVSLLKACQQLGDVQTAYNALITMKEHGIPLSKYTLNQMIKIYANAVKKEFVNPSIVEVYLKDSWILVQKAIESGEVSVNILNSLTQVYANCLKPEHISGLVLPLYQKLQIQKDVYTYQFIMEMYLKLGDLGQVYKLYSLMESENIEPNFYVLTHYLDAAIQIQDKDKIVKALKLFQQIDREPKPNHLKLLGEGKDLPSDIYNELFKFNLKFGQVKKYARKPHQKEKNELEMINSGEIKI